MTPVQQNTKLFVLATTTLKPTMNPVPQLVNAAELDLSGAVRDRVTDKSTRIGLGLQIALSQSTRLIPNPLVKNIIYNHSCLLSVSKPRI